jgi:glycosyltransferase involved in cell wall biosynthesis
VGQVSLRKGQQYLLEAWKQLKLKNSELLLIGAVQKSIEPLLRRYEGTFSHIAAVPNGRLHEYYGESAVFVLPSLSDGFGYVVTEAMACGLPVIVTSNTGAADVVQDGKQGFVVPIRSPQAIASHLERLYSDSALREEMAEAALKRAHELSWDWYASEVCEVYRSMFANHSSH